MTTRTIKICVVSDMHGMFPVIPPCDVLLLCGDNAPDFGSSDIASFRQCIWYNNTFCDWLKRTQDRVGAPCYGIAGNHDFALFRHRVSLHDDIPWTYLQDDGAEYLGLTIWGSPWVHNAEGWAFNLRAEQLDNRFCRIPDKTDILLLHGPPIGYGDGAFRLGNVREHAGSHAALNAIERVQPQLVAFGHIHEAPGQWRVGKSLLVNATLVDENYAFVHAPRMVSLDVASTAE